MLQHQILIAAMIRDLSFLLEIHDHHFKVRLAKLAFLPVFSRGQMKYCIIHDVCDELAAQRMPSYKGLQLESSLKSASNLDNNDTSFQLIHEKSGHSLAWSDATSAEDATAKSSISEWGNTVM